MCVIESAVQWAINTANDNSHGYSQADRWGADYDCSSFVISAFEQAGVPLRAHGASYTGNMRGAMIACGFVDVTNQIGLSSGYGIEAGDVLLNYSAHTCLAIGGGRVANCRTDEGNWMTGDQSGNEIRLQSYWNYPWNCVLRYKGSETVTPSTPTTTPTTAEPAVDHSLNLPTLNMSGKYSSAVVVLQAVLNLRHFPCGSADGFYGAKTQAAVNSARTYFGLEANGTCDRLLWEKLLNV